MENFFEKITFSKNAGLLCIEASKNGGINDSAIFSISRWRTKRQVWTGILQV